MPSDQEEIALGIEEIIGPMADTKLDSPSPIFVLPPEILSTVLILHAKQSLDISDYAEFFSDCDSIPLQKQPLRISNYTEWFSTNERALLKPYQWLKATHVCRHWRLVALACPELWSRIAILTYTSSSWVREMLVRSRGMPLHIMVYFIPTDIMGFLFPDAPYAFKLVLENAPRIRTLCVGGEQDQLTAYYVKSLLKGCSLYNLQTLVWDQEIPLTIIPGMPFRSCLPLFLKPENTARLRCLHIGPDVVSWGKLSLPLLTDLTLELREPTPPKMEAFLAALERMPLLESLRFESVSQCYGLQGQIDPIVVDKVVTLPRLRFLHVDSILNPGCTDLFSFFSLPALRHIALGSCMAQIRVRPSFTTLLEHATTPQRPLRTLSVSLEFTPILRLRGVDITPSLHIRGFETDRFHSTTLLSSLRLSSLQVWRYPQDSVSSSIHLHSREPDTLLGDLPAMVASPLLHLESLRTLHVSDVPFSTPDDWRRAFGTLTSVSVLDVRGQSIGEPLLEALASRGDVEKELLFPQLHTLQLEDARFEKDEKKSPGASLADLLDTLVRRSECGAKITVLHLARCINFVGEDHEKLAEVVADISWDREVKIVDSTE